MDQVKYCNIICDVAVIGGGAAGALAAIRAKREGLRVAFITKESALVGGATVMAGAGTSIMKEKDDNSATFMQDIIASGQGINNPKIVKVIADHCTEGLFDLENCDFMLDRKDFKNKAASSLPSYNKKGEGHAFSRSYLDRREALGICHGIAKTVMRNEIDIHSETLAIKLLMKDGRIGGVIAFSMLTGEYIVFTCKAAVLAVGGLGGLYQETTNSTVLNGSGYALAYDVGSEMVDMEMVQFMPLAFPYPKIRRGKIIGQCSLLGSTVRLYNKDGERYMLKYDAERAEMTTRDIGSRGNYTEIMEGRGTETDSIIVDNCNYNPEVFDRWKKTSPFRYRQCCQSFGEDGGNWKKPFEAIPSQHFFMGGIKVDEHLKSRVPGLFAAGEVTGGVHGANRLSGVAFPEIFVLGPLSGQEAADYAKNQQMPEWTDEALSEFLAELDAPLKKQEGGYRPFEIKQMIQKVMSGCLGPVRTGEGLDRAVKELEQIRKDILPGMTVTAEDRVYNRDIMEALELPLMIETAQMVSLAARLRIESRGSHYRLDYPDKSDDWLANIVIKRDGEVMDARVVPVEQEA